MGRYKELLIGYQRTSWPDPGSDIIPVVVWSVVTVYQVCGVWGHEAAGDLLRQLSRGQTGDGRVQWEPAVAAVSGAVITTNISQSSQTVPPTHHPVSQWGTQQTLQDFARIKEILKAPKSLWKLNGSWIMDNNESLFAIFLNKKTIS